MTNKINQRFFIIFIVSSFIFAGTSGKIAGRVTDQKTNEGLAGVNIVVSNTYYGAATDLDGYYTILNIPPGLYDINISMIGYKQTTVRDVRVEIDLTTTIDLKLEADILEGESVEVIAGNRILKVDVAASQLSMTGDEIDQLPVSTLGDVVGLKAGITSSFGIRGSGSDQTMLLLDGVALRDARNDAPVTGIPLSSIQEVSIQTGGFNAEYNNVRGGIINVVSKEGDPKKYSATISTKYSPPASKHFGETVYSENSFWLYPYLNDSTAWYGTDPAVAPWDEYDERQYASFDGWVAISQATLSDDDPTNDLTPSAAKRIFEWQYRKDGNIHKPDYVVDFGFGGPVPIISPLLGGLRFFYSRVEENNMYLFSLATEGTHSVGNVLKLTSDLSNNMKLSVSALWNEITGTSASRVGGTSYYSSVVGVSNIVDRTGFTIPWRIFTNDYFSETERFNATYGITLSHILSSKSYYELRLQQSKNTYKTGPGRRRNTTELTEIFPNYFIDEQPFGFEQEFLSSIEGGITLGGPISTSRDSTEVSSISIAGDYTNQFNQNNQIRTGFNLTSYKLEMKYGSINKVLEEGNRWTEFNTSPFRLNAYFQDKIEFRGLVAILGLNGEYYDPNGNWFKFDQFDSDFYYTSEEEIWDSEYAKDAKPVITLNPRLAISHPLTDNSKLYFNYGHYNQSATSEALYRIQRRSTGAIKYLGDPSLEPAMTISYELGFDRSMLDMYLLHIAAYYKDVTNEQDWTQIFTSDDKITSYIMTNNLYEDIRGIEIELSKNFGEWYTGMINYEYRVSTKGYFDLNKRYENPSDQSDYEKKNRYQKKPLPRPRAKGYLNLFTPLDFGPKIVSFRPLAAWNMNFIGRYTSGEWFKWNPGIITGIDNNVQWKDTYGLDLKISRTLIFNNISIKVFADVNNVLNLKDFSANSFENKDDYEYYMKSLHLPASIGDKLRYGNIPGDDRPGEVRPDDVAFVPIESYPRLDNVTGNDRALYWDQSQEEYFQYQDGVWVEADRSFVKQVLKDKAYIDMPNQTYYTFLNPRDIFIGLNISYNF
ncbi:MAG: carboxypeptidase regulatory-like domain-containing protein [Fidelibacterota bacterium]